MSDVVSLVRLGLIHSLTNTSLYRGPKRKPDGINMVCRSPDLNDPDDCEDDDDTSERKKDRQSKLLLPVDL